MYDFTNLGALADVSRHQPGARDGWLFTGDAGFISNEGFLFIKALKPIAFVAQFLRNATGKVLWPVLREPSWAGKRRRVN